MSVPQFFVSTPLALVDIAEACEAELKGEYDPSVLIKGASPIEDAGAGQLSFVDNPKYLKYLKSTSASAVFCKDKHLESVPKGIAALVHDEPYFAYGQALSLIYPTALRPQPMTGETGISKFAHVADTAHIEQDVIIEAGAVVGVDVRIGRGSVLLPGAVVGAGVQIGRNTTLGANTTLTNALVGDQVILHNGVQIGQDGFGFAMCAGRHHKVPQIGRVIIQDRVEIGANSTIDRGRPDRT